MLQANNKDIRKHYTLTVTHYSPDNVAEKFQQTILKSNNVIDHCQLMI